MTQRILAVVAALALLSLAACGLIQLALYPLQLLVKGITAAGEGLGSIVMVEPQAGPEPSVSPMAPGEYALDGIYGDSRFRIVVSAPGHQSRTYQWPDDFPAAANGDRRVVRLNALLEPLVGAAGTR